MVSSKDMTLRTNSNSHDDGTLSNELNISSVSTLTTRTNTTNSTSDVESDLGTLIINDETDDEDSDKTLKPAFLQHFELKENMVRRYLFEFSNNHRQFLYFRHNKRQERWKFPMVHCLSIQFQVNMVLPITLVH